MSSPKRDNKPHKFTNIHGNGVDAYDHAYCDICRKPAREIRDQSSQCKGRHEKRQSVDEMSPSKRDLFTDGFKPEDFRHDTYLDRQDCEDVAKRANQLLREALADAQTLFVSENGNSFKSPCQYDDEPTHQGKLVAIRAINTSEDT